MSVRVIPRLDIKGPNLVKGIHFEGLRVLGKPEDFARYYYEVGADELFYVDAVASLYGRNSLLEIVERTASNTFVPLTVGGGLRSVEDIRRTLRAGADKVSINTAAIADPDFVRRASRAFGSSTIVVSIEAIRKPTGEYEAYVDYGRQPTGVDPFEWAVRAAELGAGELAVTSINNEGTGRGFDLELTRRIADAVPIPVIASGGAGSVQHVVDAVTEGAADAVSVASMLHYPRARELHYEGGEFTAEGNVEFLTKTDGGTSHVRGATIPEIKVALEARGIECRSGLGVG
jgi:imidazole glycerol-phosphate synthase subunit HisF